MPPLARSGLYLVPPGAKDPPGAIQDAPKKRLNVNPLTNKEKRVRAISLEKAKVSGEMLCLTENSKPPDTSFLWVKRPETGKRQKRRWRHVGPFLVPFGTHWAPTCVRYGTILALSHLAGTFSDAVADSPTALS